MPAENADLEDSLAALRESEARYRDIFNINPNALFLIGSDGHFLEANRTAVEWYGYSPDEFRRMTPADLAVPGLSSKAPDKVKQALQEPIRFEWRHRRKDGSELPVEINTLPATISGKPCVLVVVQDISERKRTGDALQKSEAFLDSIFEGSPYAQWVSDEKGTLVKLNQACRDMLHITDQDVVGKYNMLEDNIVESQGFIPLVKEVFENGKTVEFTLKYDTRQFKQLDIQKKVFVILEVRISPLFDSEGKVTNAIVQHVDVTERKIAEQALVRANEWLALAQQSAGAGMWDWDVQTSQLTWTPELFKLFGLDPEKESATFDTWRAILHPDDRAMAEENIQLAIRNRVPLVNEYRILLPTGEIRWIDVYGNTIYDENGIAVRMTGICIDVTQRKGTEEALRESERRFRDVLENVLLLAVSLDLNGNITFINDYLLDLTGWQRDEVMGQNWFKLFFPPSLNISTIFYENLANGTIPVHYENEIITRRGEHRFVVWNNTVLHNSQGAIIGTASVGEDITERRRAEDELKRSTTLLEQSFEQSPVPMVLISMPDGIIRIVNSASKEFLGLVDEPTYVGTPLMEFKASFIDYDLDGNAGKLEDLPLARALAGRKTVNEERRIVRKDGTTRWELASGAPIFNARGDIIAGYLVMIDITGRKEAEEKIDQLNASLEQRVEERTTQLKHAQEQLVRQERLATLGKLAGSVGHELRNPLGVISNAVYYLKLIQSDAGESVREYLNILELETRNAEKIISDLLDFSRIVTADRETVPVKKLVELTLERFPVPSGSNIRVRTRIPASLPPLQVDERQVVQVLGNLVSNACQAMPEGGELRISAKVSGEMAILSVTDTGCGIAQENMARLFEPLFTTKPRGIGLGLAVSRKLAEANGGRIEVRSEPGKGSTFMVCLPVHSQ
jgi:PAS domain S-box-containing protein